MAQIPNEERKTLILTGASRGIGHATVKRFSSAGWRVITCSRHGFPENCPWEAGEEDHIQVDLAAPDSTLRAIAVMKERLKAQGGRLNALILDLRNNPGGLLDQAVAVSGEFIDRGEIVSTRGRYAEQTQWLGVKGSDILRGAPLVVLINGGSASASEIVALR